MNELARISRKMRRVSKSKYPPTSSQFEHSAFYYTVTNFWWAYFEQNRIVWSSCFFFIHLLKFMMLVWFGFTLKYSRTHLQFWIRISTSLRSNTNGAMSQVPSFKFPYSCYFIGFQFYLLLAWFTLIIFFFLTKISYSIVFLFRLSFLLQLNFMCCLNDAWVYYMGLY